MCDLRNYSGSGYTQFSINIRLFDTHPVDTRRRSDVVYMISESTRPFSFWRPWQMVKVGL